MSVFTSLPASALFSFPPGTKPGFLAPLSPGVVPAARAPPFAIPGHVYQVALDVRVPVTLAATYIVTITLLNAYNRARAKKPWAISRTRVFHAFVIAHNILLAAYSAWTYWGMLGVMRRSLVSPLGPAGLSGFADSLCRIHGPAGPGNGALFDEPSGSWIAHSPNTAASLVAHAGSPSLLDAGRIWNEGLAFYGWLFYLSKFYEVLDTFVILAKGKLSSTLQTYHHAGAMMCMWSGMRYMSPPIWMFVLVNSFIHAIMYTYYTLSALHVRVPLIVKRSLTSMQIAQFLVGASFAMAHSFISYTAPITSSTQEQMVAAGTTNHTDASATANAASATANAASAAANATVMSSLKALIFGTATGGVAIALPGTGHALHRHELHLKFTTVPCITTTGATFAIWLNVLYLAPLTYLFAKFFIASYLRRSTADASAKGAKSGRRLSSNVVLAEKAGWDAARRVEEEVYGQGDGDAIAVVEEDEDVGAGNAIRVIAARSASKKNREEPEGSRH